MPVTDEVHDMLKDDNNSRAKPKVTSMPDRHPKSVKI